LVALCRKKLKSTFSDLLLRTTNKSGRFSAKAFLVRGTAMERPVIGNAHTMASDSRLVDLVKLEKNMGRYFG